MGCYNVMKISHTSRASGYLNLIIFNEVIRIKKCKDCKLCGNKSCILNIPLLSSLSEEEMNMVAEGVEIKEYKKGELIFKTGDKADRLYIVCSGRMKIFTYLIDGREQILYVYSPGDFVGAHNLIKEDEYRYNAEALEKTTISTINKAEFDKILIKNPNITLKILEKSFERIRWAESLIQRLTSSNADAKVAGLLLNFVEDFGKISQEGIILDLSMNREEMGSFAGLSRETMTRKLNQFKDLGYIDFSGSRLVVIKNKEALIDLLLK